MPKRHYVVYLFVMLLISLFITQPLHAAENAELSKGQMIYVPAYSHIYSGNLERPFLLTVTLSVRNIDPKHEITITAIDYYETQGKLLKKFLEKPITLKQLESERYIIPEKDKTGGSGANFIVTWEASQPVNPPVVESIMIGTKSQQGISFTSRGRVIIPSPSKK